MFLGILLSIKISVVENKCNNEIKTYLAFNSITVSFNYRKYLNFSNKIFEIFIRGFK